MEALLSDARCFALHATDPSHVAAARSALQRIARDAEFDEARAGKVALVVTEAATNMLRHGGGGTLLGRLLVRGEAIGLEILAVDKGPGMGDFDHHARDGFSTGGTAGTGLGAIRRQCDEFDYFTHPGAGTILRMLLWNRPVDGRDPGDYEVGGVLVPKRGEEVCGDAWAMQAHSRGATFLVADGLGHGPDASRASASAVEVLRRHPEQSAIRILDLAHGKLRATRGAAVAVLQHDATSGDIVFAGVGNISACLWDGSSRKTMVSHNGIVGHNVHKSQEYRYPWNGKALLVAHSDGLESHWDLGAFPGIADRHPAIVAAMLYRQHSRQRDDVAVLVARKAH